MCTSAQGRSCRSRSSFTAIPPRWARSPTLRLDRYLADRGHSVRVWTTTAIDLPAFQRGGHRETSAGSESVAPAISVRRYRPCDSPRALRIEVALARPDQAPAMPDRRAIPSALRCARCRSPRRPARRRPRLRVTVFLSHCLRAATGSPLRCPLLYHAVPASGRPR